MMVGVLLAGGASKRMGSPKPLRREKGVSFLANGVRNLWTACDTVIVVLGANAKAVRSAAETEFEMLVSSGSFVRELHRARKQEAVDLEVHFVANKSWRSGMLSSVRVGLDAALELKPRGVLVLPVDHPSVLPRTVRDLGAVLTFAIEACKPAERKRFCYALVPRHRRRRGHPLALSPALALAVAGDKEASDLSDAVRRNARLLGFLDVPDAGVVRNRNTPRD